MAGCYYSVVLDHSAEKVWAVIHAFEDFRWAGALSIATENEFLSGNQPGTVRLFQMGGDQFGHRLLAHSDLDQSYTYEYCPPSSLPVYSVQSSIRVSPVVETGQAFVEWEATFECAAADRAIWVSHFENVHFAKSLTKLRSFMAARNAEHLLHGSRKEVNDAPEKGISRQGPTILRLVTQGK